MTREQKIARALELRRDGRSYDRIATEVGVTGATVWKWLHPDQVREWNKRDNATRTDKYAWARENYRGECEHCGGLTNRRGITECRACYKDRAADRLAEMIRLRAEGLSNGEIAACLGTTQAAVGTQLCRARKQGIDVPRSPYFERGLVAA